MPQKILICDDDVNYVDMLAQFLEKCGYVVWRAADASALAARMKQGDLPDLIVCDMQMPGGGGPGAVKNLRTDPATASIPIVMCSGMPEKHQAEWFRGQKGMLCVSKRAALPDILRAVRTLLPAVK